MPRLRRIGKATSEFGIANEDTCEIFCVKCYRGKYGPNESHWGHGRNYGEVDAPEHCYQCGVLLPNALTPDGVEYVQERLSNDRGNPKVRELWRKQFAHLLEEDSPLLAA